LPRDSRSRARASEASMHTSVTASRLATVLISLTLSRKVLMILMSWIYGITFLALQKYLTYSWRLLSCFYRMVFRLSIVDGRSYVPYKFTMNMAYSWSQQVMDPSGKLMSHDLATPVNALGRKLAFTQIVSSGGLNDSLINLNKLFRIAGSVIPITVASLKLVRPSYLSEWSRQSLESTSSNWGDVLF
jgi:hypothetical protein